MTFYVIVAQPKKCTKVAKEYYVGWRATISNLLIEKTTSERTVCFRTYIQANEWLSYIIEELPGVYTYNIVSITLTDFRKNMLAWTHPIFTKHVPDYTEHLNIVYLPFYLRKENK